tara:strand:+ start:1538 stop:3943 length:2406 start_codon:yes stop_codon:yes gene_type:complete
MRRNANFPSQIVSDQEKLSEEYGLKVAQAIENEWFNDSGYNNNRYLTDTNNFHKLRLYARGEQGTQKYKDELSINGDLSYLNLDWKPVPIIPKFVDIVVNGMTERLFKVNAYSQDPFGVEKRTKYMESIQKDMDTAEFNDMAQNLMNMDLYENKKEDLPENEDELALHMQLNYKQAVEIAEEQAIDVLLRGNRYDLTKKRLYYDLTVLGIAATKTSFNKSEGVTIDYVDPANLIYSYTESPYFEDVYYVGEVKEIPINELIKQFPDLTEEDLEDIDKNNYKGRTRAGRQKPYDRDKNKVTVLYFNYKSFMSEVYKMKETGTGGEKAIEKNDTFNPPENKEGGFGKLDRKIECLYEGALLLGTDKLLKWEKARNMMREKSDFTKVKMNYSIVAPRMYNGKIESLVSRITGFADMIQLTHLKLQQVMSRMVPDGIYLDADGLAEVDLGNGTNYNPQEALNMFFQTGSIIGRSFTSDGDQNPGKIPIQEIPSSGGQKMQSLIGTYNYYLQMIRDTTGLNEARDGSTPDERSLVGVQKMAAANSNTATRHILNAGLFLSAEVCEALSLRISDIIEYSPTKEAFIQAIGAHNVATLEEMAELHLYDFGIFLDLEPDEEQKGLLENNIQVALSQQTIDLEDAIDLREIKNVKLANQLLKLRRKKKQQKDQQMAQENMKAQADANAQQQQAAAQAEMQKQQALVQSEIQIEQAKAKMKQQTLQIEAEVKRSLMDHEFEINMKLKNMDIESNREKDNTRENRQDRRQQMGGEQQKDLMKEREQVKEKPFESAGNDVIGGGMRLGAFEPK